MRCHYQLNIKMLLLSLATFSFVLHFAVAPGWDTSAQTKELEGIARILKNTCEIQYWPGLKWVESTVEQDADNLIMEMVDNSVRGLTEEQYDTNQVNLITFLRKLRRDVDELLIDFQTNSEPYPQEQNSFEEMETDDDRSLYETTNAKLKSCIKKWSMEIRKSRKLSRQVPSR
eukprot:Lankesteria_metandrocarpae@DN41_c0_g1_i3.p1